MKILLAQNNHKIKDRLNLYLDNLPTNVDVYEVSSYGELEERLSQDPSIDITISCHMSAKLEGMKISGLLLNGHQSDLIVNTTESLEDSLEYKAFSKLDSRGQIIKNDINCESFHNLILDILKKRRNLNFQYAEEEYRKVRLSYFLRFNKVLCDVFIKINDDKYVKVLRKDDIYTRDDLQRYREKNIKFLYINSEDYDDFGASLATTPFLIEDRNLDPKYLDDAVVNTLDIVHEMVLESGLTDEVVNLVDYTAYQIESSLSSDRILNRLLSILKDRKDYLLDHSYMIAYFSNSICSHMEWDSEEIRKKLSYAAILQDVCLSDAKMAMVMNLQKPEMTEYTPEQIAHYQSHPEQIANIVKANDTIPLNVDEILLSQHEKPEGNGFPRGLSHHRVSQLSAVFIVAHAFVDELYREEFDLTKIPVIIKRMEKRFSVGNYRKPLEGLINVFQKSIEVA
ncbi:HD-GYP domain-containing protein [Halobacteriovorax marinus]|uniref:HD-GYP domain-containing protein n=1 Tax=Halobacteriovorax marinus TaxID=97084 RepID=UPI003A8ECDDD